MVGLLLVACNMESKRPASREDEESSGSPLPNNMFAPSNSTVLQSGDTVAQQDNSQLHHFNFNEPEMGVNFGLKFCARDKSTARRAAKEAYNRIEALNAIFSDYEPDSELNRLTRQPVGRPVKVSPELFAILLRAKALSRETKGAFDVTSGPYTKLWRQARRQNRLTGLAALKQASQSVGHEKFRLNSTTHTATCLAPNMHLDLGGIAKGWASDEALAVLRKHGIRSALCAASGDIAIGDSPPSKKAWEVGIRALDKQGNIYDRTLRLRNCAVSTSGDTVQFVEIAGQRYSHIVNPLTGKGLTNRIMVTVIAGNATETDSQATVISVLGMEKGLEHAERKGLAVIVTPMNGQDRMPRMSKEWRRRFE